jgi:3'-phosphoadenosine 5'-phosphosulfate sulfotransferase (PAPS reductase)/FAD synthetase
MLHLALKAFHPAPPPFPLLHVDTTWKFREMIAFRDETAKRLNLNLRVHTNEVVEDMFIAPTSERQGRLIDHDEVGSMEAKKRKGYF